MNTKTKKQMLLLWGFLFLSFALNAQGKNNYDKVTDVKGINYMYEFGESEIGFGIWKKQSSLMYIIPSFLEFEVIPRIEVEDRETLDILVRKYFKSYFNDKITYRYSYLYFYFFADQNGYIKEIFTRYPKEAGIIPATVVEKFETALLESNVKLKFDKDNLVFRNSQWVGREVMYNVNKLSKM